MSITIEGRVWEGVRESCGKQGPLYRMYKLRELFILFYPIINVEKSATNYKN